MMIIFKPWIGKCYSEGFRGQKVLVVGESHYGEVEDLNEDLTIEIVTKYCNVDPDSWENKSIPFFTKIATLLLEKEKADDVSWGEVGDFYNQVAFCNFLQGFAGDSPDGYADDVDFEASAEPFKSIVSELEPDVLVVFKTEQLAKYFPDIPVRKIWIQHPSRGWSYDPWRSEVKKIWQ